MQTHESYINQLVENIIIPGLLPFEQGIVGKVKCTYGSGKAGLRGVTFYDRWNTNQSEQVPFVEITAFGEESIVQLTGTTFHEIGHVLAGFGAGHSKVWKQRCSDIGLQKVKAAGTQYLWSRFRSDVRAKILQLEMPNDGAPVDSLSNIFGNRLTIKGCPQGIGTRGGKSRGVGSGSRMLKTTCSDCGYVARVSNKWIQDVGAPHCPNHGAMSLDQ